MKKIRSLIMSILCMSMLLFFNTVTDIEAAELKDGAIENLFIDTRPDYTIFVNRALNCISIVQQEADGTVTPVKTMVCSCGREGHETPEGIFQKCIFNVFKNAILSRSNGVERKSISI